MYYTTYYTELIVIYHQMKYSLAFRRHFYYFVFTHYYITHNDKFCYKDYFLLHKYWYFLLLLF